MKKLYTKLSYGRKTGLFESYFFWVGQYEVKKVKVKKIQKIDENS